MNKLIYERFKAEKKEDRFSRWRCPVCGQWVDKNAGWRPFIEEETCQTCSRMVKTEVFAYWNSKKFI